MPACLRHLFCCLWVSCCLPSAALALPAVQTLRTHYDYHLNHDGTWTMTGEVVRQINSVAGIQAAGEATIPWNSLQKLEILDAWTLTPAKHRMPVRAGNMLVQLPAAHATSATFSDERSRVIIFPGLTPGALIGYRWRITQLRPVFPGQVSFTLGFSPYLAWNDVVIHLSAPTDYPIKVAAPGLTGGPLPDRQGRHEWEWKLNQPRPAAAEPGALNGFDAGPHLVVSSFQNAKALGDAYLAGEADKARVTPEVRALAARLTRGITTPQAQARVLYDWVSGHIRYVAVLLGSGSVVPHDADTILRNRYGDCKDHAVLLEALLRARGIDSSPVILNNGPVFDDTGPIASSNYNHVITWLPQLHLFADSTAAYAPFGTLPFDDQDKTALIVREGRVVRTPMDDAQNFVQQTITLRLKADGALDGETRILGGGSAAIQLRREAAALAAGQAVPNMTGGTAALQSLQANPDALDQPFAARLRYHYDHIANLPGPGAFQVPTGPLLRSIQAVAEEGGLQPRHATWLCRSEHLTETTLLELPTGLRLVPLPEDLHFQTGPLSYTAIYRLNGNILSVNRELTLQTAHHVCPAEMANATRLARERVLRDLRTQIVYEGP